MENQGRLEREIAEKFEAIADIGWFPEDLPDDAAQLKAVREILHPREGQLILDAGCARGRFIRKIAPSGARMVGVDITSPFIRAARANVPVAAFAQGSISALPFRDEGFDSVYCIEALQHVPDTEGALRELARVVKPGGMLLIIDKSLQGLDPGKGLPNFLVKPWAERKGKWMYPSDFEFRERWFWPRALAHALRGHFGHVRVKFLPEGRGKASRLYRILPFLSLDVCWVCRK